MAGRSIAIAHARAAAAAWSITPWRCCPSGRPTRRGRPETQIARRGTILLKCSETIREMQAGIVDNPTFLSVGGGMQSWMAAPRRCDGSALRGGVPFRRKARRGLCRSPGVRPEGRAPAPGAAVSAGRVCWRRPERSRCRPWRSGDRPPGRGGGRPQGGHSSPAHGVRGLANRGIQR